MEFLLIGAQIALLSGCGIFFFMCITDYLSERKYSPPVTRLTFSRFVLASVSLGLSLAMTVASFADGSGITVFLLGFLVVPFALAMRFCIRLFDYREFHVDLGMVILAGGLTLLSAVACLWIPVGFLYNYWI